MDKYLKRILRTLLRGEFEDIDQDMKIAAYHLEKFNNSKIEFDLLIEGLKRNVPIHYIIGYTLVCGHEIIINKQVLHPGPETIILTQKAIESILESTKKSKIKILDLCTGSDAIVIAVAKAMKNNVEIVATDISESALELARQNALLNNVNIKLIQCNLFEGLSGLKFHVIICNPPYVRTNDIQNLPHFILDYSPIMAVDGGKDGMRFYDSILSNGKYFLYRNGILFLECEDRQDYELTHLCNHNGWEINEKFYNKHGNICGFKLFPIS